MNALSLTKKQGLLLIILGIILEFPVRFFISPDPWIHKADHWYFIQPSRLLIEMGFVFLAFLPFLLVKELKSLTFKNFNRKNVIFLFIGFFICSMIFSTQLWSQILKIRDNYLWPYVPVWFVTGFFIGIGQELTFRGLIYTPLKKMAGLKWAITISTVCFVFGSIHSPRMYVYLINGYVYEAFLLLFIFVLAGLLFVWMRIKTNNIIIPAIIHGIGNAITWAAYVVIKIYV
jgi:membrane protease YdiL (CAAX protease family)